MQPVTTPSIQLVPNAPRVRFRSPLWLAGWLYALLGIEIVLHVLASFVLLVSGASRHPIGTIIVNRCFEMMVVPFAVLLAWTFVAYRNLPILGAKPILRRPIVAVLVHLVPIVNLIIPFMVYKEMAVASDPNAGSQGRAPVVMWMMLYLIAASYLLVLAMSSTTISSGGASVVGPWLLVISLQNVPLIFTIRTITGRQIERARNLGLI